MDPIDGTESKRISKSDRDVESTNHSKSSVRQGSDSDEKLFTSMSHGHETNVRLSINGPLTIVYNNTNNDYQCQSNRHNNYTAEQDKAKSVINSNVEHYNVASSSKYDTNITDNGLASTSEYQTYPKYKNCIDANNSCNLNAPSTSGISVGRAWDGLQESSHKENRKRPSSLKLNRPNLDDDSSSDTGNDDYSLGSEDGCIYTYRGGEHLADLPSSFFSLDMGLPLDKHLPVHPNYVVPQQQANAREQGSRVSSPDMDFLEMDFDPGPSCEVDTGDESSPDADIEVVNMPEENEPVIRGTSPEYLPVVVQPQLIPQTLSNADKIESDLNSVPSTSKELDVAQGEDTTKDCQTYGPYITHVNARGEQFLVKRTMAHCSTNAPVTMHVSSGDLVSPREILNYDEEYTEGAHAYQINQGERSTFDSGNLSSALYHVTMAKRLMNEKTKADNENDVHNAEKQASISTECSIGCVEPPRCMVWSEREACERQVTQIGTSACGATAVVNVFIALGVPVNIERINTAVGTRLRANNAPLPRYLLSRAVAGCTAADIVTGIQKASDGLVTARFFPTYPERAMSLSHWLADWISLGAVPILTLNLQKGCEGLGEIPDAWHHQMVWGVSARGVYLSNPAECVSEAVLWPRLTSPSELLVRVRDALARFTPSTDLSPLAAVPHRGFRDLNVLGQVVNAIREWRSTGWSEYGTRTRYIRMPAAYQAGVTVAALTGSEAHRRLMHAPPPPALRRG